MTQHRELKNYEKARAKSQPRKRTIEEKWAYWYLPMSMRRHIFNIMMKRINCRLMSIVTMYSAPSLFFLLNFTIVREQIPNTIF